MKPLPWKIVTIAKCNKLQMIVRIAVFAALALLPGLQASALAPDPQPELQGFRHVAWTSQDGLGTVFDVMQAPDGYLWLTTSKGVLRFDGVRFQSVEEVTNGAVPFNDIFSVFVSPAGDVWLTTRTAGLLLWRNGTITAYNDRRCTPTAQIGGIYEGLDGSLWIQAATGLAHLKGNVCEQIGPDRGYPGGLPLGVLVDREGSVWVKTPAGDLVVLSPGQTVFQPTPYRLGPSSSMAFLHQAPDGALWISDALGLHPFKRPGAPPLAPPSGKLAPTTSPFHEFTFAPDGSLWAVGLRSVRRFDSVPPEGIPTATGTPGEAFTPKQGMSSNVVSKILVDHEGSIWLATNSGLDRLRRTALTTVPLPETEERDFAIADGDRDSVWVGNDGLPLTHLLPDGTTVAYPQAHDIISIRRDRNGTIWAAGRGGPNLWRSTPGGGLELLHQPKEETQPVFALAVDRNNELWITTREGETFQHTGDQWIPRNKDLQRKAGNLGAMTSDDAGDVWFCFGRNLVLWDGGTFHRFSFPEGSLNISASTMSVRGDHVWLAGRGGVVLFTQGHFFRMLWKDRNLPGRVSGIVETRTGDLWINGFSGVTHVSAQELTRWLRDPSSSVSAEHLDALDGLPGLSGERFPEPSVIESSSGRLWFATSKGIARLDPAALDRNRNRISPPVAISAVVVDGKSYSASNNLAFPPHTENLEIDYTALSLAIPERVLFRYKLDGVDKDWQDAGTRRQAFYTSLPPGSHRFHVIACNNDGVWNETGAQLTFSLRPAFYQTTWFRTLAVLLLAGIAWLLFRLRIRSITRQLQGRLAERLAERERIARELHDTLLQSLFGMTLRFQTAANRLPASDPARDSLNEVLRQSDKVMREGRERVLSLRARSSAHTSLAEAIAEVGTHLDSLHPARFTIAAEGRPRLLADLVQEEIVLIAREALVNAFTHSGARTVSATIAFHTHGLRVSVTDDGCGIDPAILKEGGRDGHWGLAGMRERASRIRAELRTGRGPVSGTQVELRVPASIAYQPERRTGLRWNPFLQVRRSRLPDAPEWSEPADETTVTH